MILNIVCIYIICTFLIIVTTIKMKEYILLNILSIYETCVVVYVNKKYHYQNQIKKDFEYAWYFYYMCCCMFYS